MPHGRIDLLRPTMVGFNATGTPTAQEFPVWQAAAGLAFKVAGSTWYGWANIVSLLLFSTALWTFFQLARQYAGERAAWWSLLFFLAEPIIILTSGQAATDGFCLATILWFLFFADKMIRSGQLFMVGAHGFFATLMRRLQASVLLRRRPRQHRALVGQWHSQLETVGAARVRRRLVAAINFLPWTRYTDTLSVEAEYPFVDLRVNHNPWIKFWFFGDLHFRLSPGPWIKGGWRFMHGTLGSLPVIGLLVISFLQPGNRVPKLWLARALSSPRWSSHTSCWSTGIIT